MSRSLFKEQNYHISNSMSNTNYQEKIAHMSSGLADVLSWLSFFITNHNLFCSHIDIEFEKLFLLTPQINYNNGIRAMLWHHQNEKLDRQKQQHGKTQNNYMK